MESRTALVVRGGWDGHQPVEATDSFLPFLRSSDFVTVVRDSLDCYADAALMERADLIVQCWTMGTIVSALGVYLSLKLDLPTGATIVCTFGLVLIIMAAVRPLIQKATPRDVHHVDFADRAHERFR